jgi:2-polyprenyl-3-methyl-5-hydroxy-6-metoxy-1,4-benzoquinol methylase
VLTDTEQKQGYFNQYWQTRDLPSADARSIQRADAVRSLLGEPQGKRLIDVGCGRGVVLARLYEAGYDISGCDISSESVAALKRRGCVVFLHDIETDRLRETYDGILCLEVLQQVFDPVGVLRRLAEHLKDDGVLIVSVPNEFHIWSRIRLLLGKSHLGHFEESHIRLFTPRRAKELFDQAWLRMEQIRSISIIPPKYKILGWIGRILTAISPNLFALSQIYRVRKP